jgi:hypothetical protein
MDNDVTLIAHTNSILKAMTGNPHFPSPLPKLKVVADAMNTFMTAEMDAAEGDLSMNNAKIAARGLLVKLLRHLAGYVQMASHGDPAIILSSGFSIENLPSQLIEALPPSLIFAAARNWNGSRSGSFETTAFSSH